MKLGILNPQKKSKSSHHSKQKYSTSQQLWYVCNLCPTKFKGNKHKPLVNTKCGYCKGGNYVKMWKEIEGQDQSMNPFNNNNDEMQDQDDSQSAQRAYKFLKHDKKILNKQYQETGQIDLFKSGSNSGQNSGIGSKTKGGKQGGSYLTKMLDKRHKMVNDNDDEEGYQPKNNKATPPPKKQKKNTVQPHPFDDPFLHLLDEPIGCPNRSLPGVLISFYGDYPLDLDHYFGMNGIRYVLQNEG